MMELEEKLKEIEYNIRLKYQKAKKNNRRIYKHKCAYCGIEFETTSYKQKSCNKEHGAHTSMITRYKLEYPYGDKDKQTKYHLFMNARKS